MKYVGSGRYTTSNGSRLTTVTTVYDHHTSGTNTAMPPKHKVHDVLLDIQGWRLVRARWPGIVGCESYIVHFKCPNTPRTPGGGLAIPINGACANCEQSVPDEITGLSILHNGKI